VRIHVPLALKLYSYGLQQLHDPNWTGIELYDRLKGHLRGRTEPVELLWKTIPNGLLYHLGLWFYEAYVLDDEFILSLEGEYRTWYLEDLLGAIVALGARENQKAIKSVVGSLERIWRLYDEDEGRYFDYLESQEGEHDLLQTNAALIRANWRRLTAAMPLYAANYADRVFHDRQLCEHIAKTVALIGFDGRPLEGEDIEPRQWVERRRLPEWAREAIRARDRGKCSSCGVDIAWELEGDQNFDHIVPLAQGGNNDLVNFQLLCAACNTKKNASRVDVISSVPPYISRRIRER